MLPQVRLPHEQAMKERGIHVGQPREQQWRRSEHHRVYEIACIGCRVRDLIRERGPNAQHEGGDECKCRLYDDELPSDLQPVGQNCPYPNEQNLDGSTPHGDGVDLSRAPDPGSIWVDSALKEESKVLDSVVSDDRAAVQEWNQQRDP